MKDTITLVTDKNNTVWASKKEKYWVTEDGSKGCGRNTLEKEYGPITFITEKRAG